jgi:aminoglycoside 2'-N-acetyltransferase I
MAGMTQLRTAHTAELDAATLTAARAPALGLFDDLTEDDGEDFLGGTPAPGHAARNARK